MPLVPIRGVETNSSMLSANQTLVSQHTCLTPQNGSTRRPVLGSEEGPFLWLTGVSRLSAEEAARQADALHVLREYPPLWFFGSRAQNGPRRF